MVERPRTARARTANAGLLAALTLLLVGLGAPAATAHHDTSPSDLYSQVKGFPVELDKAGEADGCVLHHLADAGSQIQPCIRVGGERDDVALPCPDPTVCGVWDPDQRGLVPGRVGDALRPCTRPGDVRESIIPCVVPSPIGRGDTIQPCTLPGQDGESIVPCVRPADDTRKDAQDACESGWRLIRAALRGVVAIPPGPC